MVDKIPSLHTTPDSGPGRPIRLLHVLGHLNLAGMEYGVIKLVNRLDPERFEPMICCLHHQKEETRGLLSPRVPVFELHKSPGRDWGIIGKLRRLLKERSVDLVHSHNWPTFFYTVAAARLAGTPVVLHGEHGLDSVDLPWRRRLMNRVLSRLVDHMTAVSKNIAAEVMEGWKVRPEDITFIPNGVDLEKFGRCGSLEGLRGELRLKGGDRVILNIGGLRPIKDHPTLIRAFAEAQHHVPEARLVLVGGEASKGMQRQIELLASDLGIASEVRFAGVRQDIPQLLELADVYANSSTYEGMSNTLLEAMAAGKPVVATAVGGNPDLVEDGVTGFLVPPGDDERLAQRLVEILADRRLAAALGEAGRSLVERRHAMGRMVELYGGLYEEALCRKRLAKSSPPGVRASRWLARGLSGSGLIFLKECLGPPYLPVLTYHRVLPLQEALECPFPGLVMPRDSFEAQLAYLSRRCRVLDLVEAVSLLRQGKLPRRAAAIILDGGYRDNHEHAWPLLEKYRLPATLFVVPPAVDRKAGFWWEEVAREVHSVAGRPEFRLGEGAPNWLTVPLVKLKAGGRWQEVAQAMVSRLNELRPAERQEALLALKAASPTDPAGEENRFLTWDQIREMSRAGLRIGGRALGFSFQDETPLEEWRREIFASAARLKEELGAPAASFSCPAGRLSDQAIAVFKEAGIEVAVTADLGPNGPECDPYQVKRLKAGSCRSAKRFEPALFRAELQGWFDRKRKPLIEGF